MEELEKLKYIQNEMKKLDEVLKHLQTLHSSCITLAKNLLENGENPKFCRMLIANGFQHDQSKFYGIEWEYLNPESFKDNKDLFVKALQQHQEVNPHHPEFWDGFEHMPRIRIAEMVADWHARSVYMGTDLRKFFKEDACKKYNIKPLTKGYKEINYFIDMLLGKPFKKVK